jgi:hypothetical protein
MADLRRQLAVSLNPQTEQERPIVTRLGKWDEKTVTLLTRMITCIDEPLLAEEAEIATAYSRGVAHGLASQ